MNQSVKPLLKMSQVAERMQCSRTQAYRLASNGTLPSVRFGNLVRVREEDINEFILRQVPDKSEEPRLTGGTVDLREHRDLVISEKLEDILEFYKKRSLWDGFVYFFGFEDMVKIGSTTNVRQRLLSIKTMSPTQPEKFTIELVIRGDADLEHKLQECFCDLRSHGEWFYDRPSIMAAINYFFGNMSITNQG